MILYIDPGTGSMLFAIFVGIAGAISYALRNAIVKVKFLLSGGRNVEANDGVIPYAIYSDDKRYWNVFEPICREFDKRGIDIVYLTSSEDDPAFDADLPHMRASFIGEGNKAFAKLNLLRATMLISTTPGLDVYQWKRSKEVRHYAHVLHAASEVLLYRMFGIDYYDSVLVSGQFQVDDVRALEKLRNLPAKDVQVVGVPYMDEMAKRLKAGDPVGEHERTVLLAPSWGPLAIFGKYGDTILQQLIDTGYRVIVRPHPQSFESEADLIKGIMEKYPESDQVSWNQDVDNFECLRSADILISDFSGVIFDFALVYDKPIIYADANIDVDPYDAWWLDKELWTKTALPRLGMQLSGVEGQSLKEMIDTCIDDPRFAQTRAQVRDEVWSCYGHGAEKTVDFLVSKYEQLEPSAES